MNSYFMSTPNSDVVQSPVTFEPAEKTFNSSSSAIDIFVFYVRVTSPEVTCSGIT